MKTLREFIDELERTAADPDVGDGAAVAVWHSDSVKYFEPMVSIVRADLLAGAFEATGPAAKPLAMTYLTHHD